MRFIKHKYLIFVLLLFYFAKFQGQTHITGLIENKNGIPIENASVVIHDFSNQIIAYNYTNVKGSFSIVIELEINHDYKLLVNSLRYQEYTININTEMNYWPSEVTNLSELNEPLVQMVRELSETGKKQPWICMESVDGLLITTPTYGELMALSTVLSGECGPWAAPGFRNICGKNICTTAI